MHGAVVCSHGADRGITVVAVSLRVDLLLQTAA